MESDVVFSDMPNHGSVDVFTHIWNLNEFFGFTGGVVVFFLDSYQ
jgi:hypothetical protein